MLYWYEIEGAADNGSCHQITNAVGTSDRSVQASSVVVTIIETGRMH